MVAVCLERSFSRREKTDSISIQKTYINIFKEKYIR